MYKYRHLVVFIAVLVVFAVVGSSVWATPEVNVILEPQVLVEDKTLTDAGTSVSHYTPDGHFAVFSSKSQQLVGIPNPSGVENVYRLDLTTGIVQMISVSEVGLLAGNSASSGARISEDGCKVTFVSTASNLVSDDTNGYYDIYQWDCVTDSVRRLSYGIGGSEPNDHVRLLDVTSDGNKALVLSSATNLILQGDSISNAYILDSSTGKYTRIQGSVAPNADTDYGSISKDGRYVAFATFADNLGPIDQNEHWIDVYLKDTLTGEVLLVSPNVVNGVAQESWDVMISPSGRYLAYVSKPTVYPYRMNVLRYDTLTGSTVNLTSGGNNSSGSFSGVDVNDSGDVVYTSRAYNLVDGLLPQFEQRLFIYYESRSKNYLLYDPLEESSNALNNPSFEGFNLISVELQDDLDPMDSNGYVDSYEVVFEVYLPTPTPTAMPTITPTPTATPQTSYEIFIPIIVR